MANKDRVWLAVDHTVDPRNYSEPKPAALIKLANEFAEDTGITDYWRPNTTIMHTEFARQRAQPGQIVIGADSHTCSAGGMGSLAIGLGAGDVVLPLVTGQTWLQVPETLLIEFVGEPAFGVGGKDIILHVLGVLKRNTVANERAVEWRGPGLKYMSADARFAIANMTTEFGGIAGVFEADEQTARTLAARAAHKDEGLYFRADADASYADRYTIDLSTIVPQVALFPSPDNCKPVTELTDMKLDGCFIGACTTTQEDLILAALVLEAAMQAGLKPVATKPNMRRVTPGSLAIVAYLREHGILDIYERAGFVVGSPGCSYCLGIAADVAGDGEVWLSSQNRNFKNRMGKGSIANLASAVVVAASAFGMTVTDPTPYLAAVSKERFDTLREWIPSASLCHSDGTAKPGQTVQFKVTEPAPALEDGAGAGAAAAEDPALSDPVVWSHLPSAVTGKVQRFGDMVDTDAIIPASVSDCVHFRYPLVVVYLLTHLLACASAFICYVQFMGCSPADMVKYGGRADMSEDEFLGSKCFAYVRPEFVSKVQEGFTVVVAQQGFGCGSSREEAVRSLKASGVQAVIAQSFAFIYARNQPNMNLMGVIVRDAEFYELAIEGSVVTVDVPSRTVTVAGSDKTFPFTLSRMEERFLQAGGVEKLYKTFRKELFKALVKGPKLPSKPVSGCGDDDCGSGGVASKPELAW